MAPFPLFAGDPKALFLARGAPWKKVITTIILIIGSSNIINFMTVIVVVVVTLSSRHHHLRLCQGWRDICFVLCPLQPMHSFHCHHDHDCRHIEYHNDHDQDDYLDHGNNHHDHYLCSKNLLRSQSMSENMFKDDEEVLKKIIIIMTSIFVNASKYMK